MAEAKSKEKIELGKAKVQKVKQEYFKGHVFNVTTDTGNLFVNDILVKNSGGLGTPAYLRVEAGAIHKAHKGVLFIDEIATLKHKSQQGLLTAMQERKYPITGQSEMSSGAQVKTEPVPCDFVLVAAGNYPDLKYIHPALRSRIRGYGYEVHMEDTMDDTPENQLKIVQFVAQEIKKDGKIPHFSRDAIEEIVLEARKRSGKQNKLTLKLRELGGLIRAAGDLAKIEGSEFTGKRHLEKAKTVARTLEWQIISQSTKMQKTYEVFLVEGSKIGRVNGLAVSVGPDNEIYSGSVLPIEAEVAPTAEKEVGHIIATGKLGEIANEAVENVSAIIKKHIGKNIYNYDIHVQFLQAYGVEGDSASISVATAVLSALEQIPVRQDIAMTGSISVRGEVLPIGGVTQKVEAAIEAGVKTVVIPKANARDLILSEEAKKKIEIIETSNIMEVLQAALDEGKKKKDLLKKLSKEISWK